MPLDDQHYVSILHHLQATLREVDSDLFARVSQSVRPVADPAESLLDYLATLIRLIGDRSNRSYFQTLARLNQHVHTEDDEPISSIKVLLSDTERSMYGADELDLSRMVSFEDILPELKTLYDEIAEDRRSR